MFGDMMDKLRKMQEEVELAKKRLSNQEIQIEKEGIRVRINGMREIREIEIDDSLMADREMLQDILVVTINRAVQDANAVNEREMAGTAQSIMPNIPGM
jgi:hypothetical protein